LVSNPGFPGGFFEIAGRPGKFEEKIAGVLIKFAGN
jgi:hypothetical protein